MRNVALDEITRLHAEVDRLTAFAQEASRLYKAQKVRADKVEAVVRELAEALEAAQNSLCASTDYQKVPSNRYGLERIRAALVHPLVKAARNG